MRYGRVDVDESRVGKTACAFFDHAQACIISTEAVYSSEGCGEGHLLLLRMKQSMNYKDRSWRGFLVGVIDLVGNTQLFAE